MTPDGLATTIGETLGVRLQPRPARRVQGGCINECYRWEGDTGAVFVKVAQAGSSAMLEAEAAGLETLQLARAVRVPRVLGVGVFAETAWLALEWIQTGTPTRVTDALLGEQLALQHRCVERAFGWSRNNTIGSTPQLNDWNDNWVQFLRERRLQYQLSLAERNGYGGRLQQRGGT